MSLVHVLAMDQEAEEKSRARRQCDLSIHPTYPAIQALITTVFMAFNMLPRDQALSQGERPCLKNQTKTTTKTQTKPKIRTCGEGFRSKHHRETD